MNWLHVEGAQPNFMKVAPVTSTLAGRSGVQHDVVHTGLHFDVNTAEVFWANLECRRQM